MTLKSRLAVASILALSMPFGFPGDGYRAMRVPALEFDSLARKPATPDRRKKRKAQRAARKRNRK